MGYGINNGMSEAYRYSPLDNRIDYVNDDGDVSSSAYDTDTHDDLVDMRDTFANEAADRDEWVAKYAILYACGAVALQAVEHTDAIARDEFESAVDAICDVHTYANQVKGMRVQRKRTGGDFNTRYKQPGRVLAGAEHKLGELRHAAQSAELFLSEEAPGSPPSPERVAMRRAIVAAGKPAYRKRHK